MTTEFVRQRWLQPTEDGANTTKTCWGTSTVTICVKLMCACWKIMSCHSKRHSVGTFKV